ncbi:uncharacterized protein CFP56_027894 [Quercus suber]|uniref:DUF4283 domain-containing protein n=1 Tax=Quercus suber TaxID=58331 RepID=A0AAW0JWQ0_QUESU|nr:uncharacterized protein CFP56_55345 [Quercus suber]
MAEELEELWKKLKFTEEEDARIDLDSTSTKAARAVGKCCAIMKIWTQRSINLDALRKNLRMLWKPNKGVQISELEEEVFLVEFGDVKDKKKVLDMCPWSYEKQLVIIQEFEGELTPKEIDLKWVPFWVQIYNLPLKSRTRETGWAIGSSLGSVLEVDVPDSGVQWGRCLRVSVRIDVTRRLVRRRKITIEGGESKWVNFKYERLPNFCYKYRFLNHALKDCNDDQDQSKLNEENQLQYGAWLRGEPVRWGGRELNKQVYEGVAMQRSGATVGTTLKSAELMHTVKEASGVGECHVNEKPCQEDSYPTQSMVGLADSMPMSEDFHEIGKVQKVMGKVEGKETKIGKSSIEKSVAQPDLMEDTQVMTAINQEVQKENPSIQAPNHVSNLNVDGPNNESKDLGPIAMSFDENKG